MSEKASKTQDEILESFHYSQYSDNDKNDTYLKKGGRVTDVEFIYLPECTLYRREPWRFIVTRKPKVQRHDPGTMVDNVGTRLSKDLVLP